MKNITEHIKNEWRSLLFGIILFFALFFAGVANAQIPVPTFSAYMSSAFTAATNTVAYLPFDSTDFNVTGDFDVSTYTFTPSVAGYYLFNASVACTGTGTTRCTVILLKNGAGVSSQIAVASFNNTSRTDLSYIVEANGTSDYFQLVGINGTAGDFSAVKSATYFSAGMLPTFIGLTSTSSPYIIDVGTSVMLGGLLVFLVAYWLVGLIRRSKSI